MHQTMIDAEKLAALLDGRLDANDRAELLESLSESDAGFEAYAEATAVLLELESEDRATGVIPLRPRNRAGWRARRGLLMIAAAAGLAGVVALQGIRSDGDVRLSAGTFIALVGDGVSSGERPDSGWPVLRASGISATETGVALRLGAELAWLRIAMDAGDYAAVRQSAITIDSLLDRMPGAAPLAAAYRNIADEADRRSRPSPELRGMIEEAAAATHKLAGGEFIALGAWMDMGRVALQRGNLEYFTSAVTDALIGATESNAELPEVAMNSLREIRAAANDGRDDVIRAELERLPLLLESSEGESFDG